MHSSACGICRFPKGLTGRASGVPDVGRRLGSDLVVAIAAPSVRVFEPLRHETQVGRMQRWGSGAAELAVAPEPAQPRLHHSSSAAAPAR